MKQMDSETIRHTFVDYFVRHGHRHLPSASLIPPSDTGSLLTIAGMQQITPYLPRPGEPPPPPPRHGAEVLPHRTTSRKWATSGTRTFFEMLGNFLRRRLLQAGCDCLRVRPPHEWLRDRSRRGSTLRFTPTTKRRATSGGPSGSSATASCRSRRTGGRRVPWDRTARIPKSTLTVARQYGKDFPAGGPDHDDRYLEIVEPRLHAVLSAAQTARTCRLPRPHIDTGMGLERIAMHPAGRTDGLRDRPACSRSLRRRRSSGERRLWARREGRPRTEDYLRPQPGVTFLISDGVLPSNEGRGYVLRRVLRRRSGRVASLGIERPFATDIVGAVIDKMARSLPGTARARSAHPPRRRARGRGLRARRFRRGLGASTTARRGRCSGRAKRKFPASRHFGSMTPSAFRPT